MKKHKCPHCGKIVVIPTKSKTIYAAYEKPLYRPSTKINEMFCHKTFPRCIRGRVAMFCRNKKITTIRELQRYLHDNPPEKIKAFHVYGNIGRKTIHHMRVLICQAGIEPDWEF